MSTPNAWSASKVLAGLVGVYFTAGTIRDLVIAFRGPPQAYVASFLVGLLAAATAAMCWWFVVRGHIPESRADMSAGCLGGIMVGVAGFVVGSAVPLILQPEASEGPLLGFLTGPLGAVVGTAVTVGVRAYRRRRKPPPELMH